MKLLIITQKVDKNDAILGFFHRWILEFAKNVESVIVIALYVGEHDLPKNVRVLSLGKDEGVSRLTYIFRFYKYIFKYRKDYDSVFVHMNQIYILLGGLLWRILGKKISLWYAHGSVSLSLRVTVQLVHNIFTSTKSGFRLKSRKIHVIGQGIDTELFSLKDKKNNKKFEIISVGRISPVKDYETLIDAVEILSGQNLHVTIIGDAGLLEQEKYFSGLKKMVEEKNLTNKIHFAGSMSNNEIVKNLQESDLFINTSHTGSLDKAILEAMSVGLPVLTCNEALLEVLKEHKNNLMFQKKDSKTLADKILYIISLNGVDREHIGSNLRDIVIENHTLYSFIEKIIRLTKI